MSIVYLNGAYLPLAEAKISVLDRGFLFADGVYEVIPVYAGKPFRLVEHLQRLNMSLSGIQLKNPHSETEWLEIIQQLLAYHNAGDQLIYLQLSRGAADKREHLFPEKIMPTVFLMSTPLPVIPAKHKQFGLTAITAADIRWAYCDLKTIALLPNVLLRQQAKEQNADEVIFIRDGYVTECSTSNIFLVHNHVLITPPKSRQLLPGITRDLILQLAQQHAMPYQETSIPEAWLKSAAEIWMTSSTKEVLAVTRLNNALVGDGMPGEWWQQMSQWYAAYKQSLA